ncbi:succinate dehydrogenase, hydrophobic membrane anchor protein [Methylomonas sp. SURF-2]|uniref:Succinate dehydrogenase hydrophobic membrane anchor subunit n=1 Tax=Methylomonas subterranea TaxID=2952225 RepID=A0ABT1TE51_9GAMM|nr:succinate dehydrogenase, hydrophobic membrane anchor protein [Methylomonas sp. SURF-2]MCQ8103735.1 succinate dehydrogenase, hydrophobic membrane anchor protein [Methylomonas sp. SURF-2]
MSIKSLPGKIADCFSIHNATGHFWYQRVTALALIPLSVWLLVLLNKALSAPYADTVAWLTAPVNAAAIVAWTLAVIFHAALGAQVVIEDYVSTLSTRQLAIRATNLIFLLLGIAASSAIVFIFSAR